MSEYVDFQNALALAIASGIGGDGEMMVQETLWEGTPVQYPITVTCNKNPYEYDLLIINTTLFQDIFYVKDCVGRAIRFRHATNNNYYQCIEFTLTSNSKDISFIKRDSSGSNIDPYWLLTKVIGIKFTGTKSIDYSTEEQIIGKWIDGKPLYQKTVIFREQISQKNYSHGIANIDKVIDYKCIFRRSDISSWGVSAPATQITNSSYFSNIYGITSDAIIVSGNNFTNATGGMDVTIQYTKTTD